NWANVMETPDQILALIEGDAAPHPAPAAATGEGEVRMFLAVDAVGSDVHVQTSEAEGWVVACADEDSALFLEDKLRVFVHRPEAAALHAPRKTEAEGADTSTPPADDAAGESPLYIGYQQCLDWLRKGVEAHWPVDADSDPD